MRLPRDEPVLVRPIRPDDGSALVAGFHRLSPETRRQRFCGATARLSSRQVRYFTHVDHVDHEALVAIEPRTGEGLGVVRYVRLTHVPDTAEFAATVRDDWQCRGLGTALSRRLLVRARAAGIRRLEAYHLAENRAVVALLRRLGPVALGPTACGGRTAVLEVLDTQLADGLPTGPPPRFDRES